MWKHVLSFCHLQTPHFVLLIFNGTLFLMLPPVVFSSFFMSLAVSAFQCFIYHNFSVLNLISVTFFLFSCFILLPLNICFTF
jgi:hypothetical protein